MNPHLTSQQVSQWILGERSPRGQEHVNGCPECRQQISDLQEVLAGFRSSVRRWSEQQIGAPPRAEWQAGPVRPWAAWSRLLWNNVGWATAILAICLVAVVATHPRGVPQSPAEAADAALLKQVDLELSRAVPGPLEPLAELVLWDGNATKETARAGKKSGEF